MMTVAVGNRCLVAMVAIVLVVAAVLVDVVHDEECYCHTLDYGHRLPNPNCYYYQRSSIALVLIEISTTHHLLCLLGIVADGY